MGPGSGILGPVGTLLEGRKGEIYATTAYGLFVYDPKRPPAPPPSGADRWDDYDLALPVSPIRDSEGNLWMMLRDRPGEISCWDGHAWRHQKVPFDTSKIEFAMADDRGHVLLGEREIQYNVSPDGVAKYTDFKQALVAAIARGARRFDPECVAVNDGKELYLHFPYQEIQYYDGKQWHRLNLKKRFCLLESAQYGALIRTEWNEYYACERGQIRRVDVPADSTRWLWSGSGCQPYEAALLAAHPREYLPIEGGRASDPWLLRQPVGPASADPSERRAARAAFLRDVRVFSGNGSPDGWLSQGYSEGHWAAGNSGPTLYRIFAEQVINCRLDQGPLTGHGYFTPQILEDRAHNLWFDISSPHKAYCKRVEGFVLRGPEAAVEVAERGTLDVQVAPAWQEERPLRLFWRNDDGRWRWGEIGPLAPGDHQVEMIAMGPQGETTPAPIRCSILVRGQAAWVVPRIAGHEMEDDAPMEQARKSFGYYGVPILEDAVRHSPHNVYYWAALVDALSNEERASFPFNDHAGRFAERASREALKLNPGDPLLLVARAGCSSPAQRLTCWTNWRECPDMPTRPRRCRRSFAWVFCSPNSARTS